MASTYASGRLPVGGWAEAAPKAIKTPTTKNGTLSRSDCFSGRFSTKRSRASNTAGKVATESLPATPRRNKNTEAPYHQ